MNFGDLNVRSLSGFLPKAPAGLLNSSLSCDGLLMLAFPEPGS